MATFEKQAFSQPPKHCRPLVRWWWPGLDVEIDELVAEVRDMDERGFGGAEVQAFMIGSPPNLAKSDPGRRERAHRFMQPYYYQALRAVLDEASQHDLLIDLTICSAWPAGGTHVTPEKSLRTMAMGATAVKGPKLYQGRLPRFPRPPITYVPKRVPLLGSVQSFDRDALKPLRVLAARPVNRPGKVHTLRAKTTLLDIDTVRDITDCLQPDGTMKWQVPDGTWQIFAIYAGPSRTHPLYDAREEADKTSYVIDHFASEPVTELLDHHFGREDSGLAEHMGKTFRAFFTDSLELAADWAWTPGFLAEFEQRRGYDLTPYLPCCYIAARDNKYAGMMIHNRPPSFEFAGDLGKRIRHDYEHTVADLFVERFVQAMTDWAEPRGLQSRIQAYGIRADTLRAFGAAHIPETEQLYAGGNLDFLKLAGSAAAIYGKPIVTSESLVWMGRDYLTTPLKFKIAADRLFVSGINQMILHGYPYQHKGYPYPGFQPFSTPYLLGTNFSSDFSASSAFAESMTQLNTYVARVQYLMQSGPACPQIGVFYPLLNYPDASLQHEEMMQGYVDEHDVPLKSSALMRPPKHHGDDEQWIISACDMANQLTAHGYNYVHINEERLLNAVTVDRRLQIGSSSLDALVLVQQETVSVALAERLERFAQAGLPILFVGRIPDRQPGFFEWQNGDAKVAETMRAIAARRETLIASAADLPSRIKDMGVQPHIVYDEPQPTIHYIERSADSDRIFFFRNGRRETKTVAATVIGESRTPMLLDPSTGAISPAPRYRISDQGVELTLEFAPFGSACLLFSAVEDTQHATQSELPLMRTDKLVALARKAGSFAVQLGDGSTAHVDVPEDAPATIDLRKWHLTTTPRAANGTFGRLDLDLEKLADWRKIETLQYCSSPGLYTASFDLDATYLQPSLALTLNMGLVYDVATVSVNGTPLAGHITHYPFEADLTGLVHEGNNTIEIEVTPTLHNRLVGYGKQGHKDWKRFKSRRHLCPSGLIGPVTLSTCWHYPVTKPEI